MSYSIKTIPKFDKNLKRLSKKYPSLKLDFIRFIESLKDNPTQGDLIYPNCYKIRLKITSKGKGKSGGARIITHVLVEKKVVYLLSVYNKSEKATVSNRELKDLMQFIKV